MLYCNPDLDPALVGLTMVYAITLIGRFQNCIRTSAEVENLVRNFTMNAKNYNHIYLDGISRESNGIW